MWKKKFLKSEFEEAAQTPMEEQERKVSLEKVKKQLAEKEALLEARLISEEEFDLAGVEILELPQEMHKNYSFHSLSISFSIYTISAAHPFSSFF